jgi:hypothetical protein
VINVERLRFLNPTVLVELIEFCISGSYLRLSLHGYFNYEFNYYNFFEIILDFEAITYMLYSIFHPLQGH